MKTIVVKQEELLDILKRINLVKVKFGYDDIWTIAPVLYTTEDSIDIIADVDKVGQTLTLGEKIVLKFQRLGFEYLVNGVIFDISKGYITTTTIKFSVVQKLYNQRHAMRFDTELMVFIKSKDEGAFKGLVKNISKGGAMIISDTEIELNSLVGLTIAFNSGKNFNTIAKVLRRSLYNGNTSSYGVQFIEILDDDNEIINKEIIKLERDYLNSLTIMREYSKKSGSVFKSKVAIFSNDVDDSYEIREALVKLGAENFDVFHNFKFYIDFFIEEKPKVVIIDTDSINDEITKVISNINELGKSLLNTKVLLILPISFSKRRKAIESKLLNVRLLFKPLIHSEFEGEILKYL